MSSGRSWRQDAPVWLLLALLPVAAHLPALSGMFRFDPIYSVSGLVTPGSPGLLAGLPWIDGNAGVTTEALGALAARDWLSGIVPWWNPYSGIGLPLAAEGQTTAFFLPFGLLLALPHGLLLLRMILMALAGFFTLALLRRLGLARAPALAGAILFELNGTFAWFAHGPILPVAFLPLMLLGLEQARDPERAPPRLRRPGALPLDPTGAGRPQTPSVWRTVPPALILGTAWTFLAGFPETAALDLAFAGLWATLRLWQARGARLAYAWRAGAATLCGLLLAAPAIWSFLEALPREFLGWHGSLVGGGWRAGVAGLMLFPYSQGGLLATHLQHIDGSAAWYRLGGTVPLLPACLALAALRRRGPDNALRWTLFGWILLTGSRAVRFPPTTALFAHLPLLHEAAIHLYMMPSWSMAAAILTSLTLQDWREGVRPNWTIPLLFLAPLAALSLVWSAPQIAAAPHALAAGSILLSLGLVLAAYLLTRRPAAPPRTASLVAALGAQALAIPMIALLAGPHGARVDTEAIRFLQAHTGLSRIATFSPFWANYGAMFGVPEINHNYLPLPQNWVDAVHARFMPRSDGINFQFATRDLATLPRIAPALRDAGVRYILTYPGIMPSIALPLVFSDSVMSIWQLPDPAPYWTAPGCHIAGSRTDIVTDCPQPATLIRRELAWPGWTARINGQPTPLGTQDLFQTLDLPAGRSHIAFAYAPPGALWAWLAAAAGALGLALATLYSGSGMNSWSSAWGSRIRPARQSARACAIRSREDETKFHST